MMSGGHGTSADKTGLVAPPNKNQKTKNPREHPNTPHPPKTKTNTEEPTKPNNTPDLYIIERSRGRTWFVLPERITVEDSEKLNAIDAANSRGGIHSHRDRKNGDE